MKSQLRSVKQQIVDIDKKKLALAEKWGVIPFNPLEGDVVKFKVVGKDPKTKKFKLSRKVLLPKPETAEGNN